MGAKGGLASKRITWLDMAKGVGIILVMAGHISPYSIFWKWIYTFHLPLFFALSGYVFKMGDGFSAFFKKKCKSLLLPYFGLGIPFVLFDWLYNNGGSIDALRNLVLQFLIQRRYGTLWFLACLFFLNLLFYLTVKVLKTNGKLTICAVVFVALGVAYYAAVKAFLPGGIDAFFPHIPPIDTAPNDALPWNIDATLMAYPFFFVGYLYKEKRETVDKVLDSKKWAPILFVVLAAVNIGGGYLNNITSGYGYSLGMWESRYACVPLTYLVAFAGIICVIMVSKWITIPPVRYIGEHSIIYFAWHQTIAKPLMRDFLNLFSLAQKYIEGCPESYTFASDWWWYTRCYRLVWLLLIIAFCTLCTLLVTRTPLRCLLGQPPFPSRKNAEKEK